MSKTFDMEIFDVSIAGVECFSAYRYDPKKPTTAEEVRQELIARGLPSNLTVTRRGDWPLEGERE